MPELEKDKKNSLKESMKDLKNKTVDLSTLADTKKETEQSQADSSVEQGEDSKTNSAKANKKQDKNSKLKAEIAKLKEDLELALKDNLYLRAEFENFKKRSFEEQRNLIRFGGERFIVSLANEVLDDLDRAFALAQDDRDIENIKKGLSLIQKKLSQVLNNFGVQVIDPKGKAFDPSYQEALSSVKTSNTPDGHVAETFKKAYKLHDKVIRPAQVVLAKKDEKK